MKIISLTGMFIFCLIFLASQTVAAKSMNSKTNEIKNNNTNFEKYAASGKNKKQIDKDKTDKETKKKRSKKKKLPTREEKSEERGKSGDTDGTNGQGYPFYQGNCCVADEESYQSCKQAICDYFNHTKQFYDYRKRGSEYIPDNYSIPN